MFRVELLPADRGDCIWIEYGDTKELHRILVDCGPPQTLDIVRRRIESISPPEQRRFELLIATHIDSDHIGGLARLLDDPPKGLIFGDIWFNGYRHLHAPEKMLGVPEAEEITDTLVVSGFSWNEAFDKGPVEIPERGGLPQRQLPGGMRLTLISPYRHQLEELYPQWHQKLELLRKTLKEPPLSLEKKFLGSDLKIDELATSKFREDQDKSNRSSIAVIAEYGNRVLLLAGDTPSDILIRSLDRIALRTKVAPLHFDAFKISHHGSAHSTSSRLLRRILCEHYLFSTSGSVHGHPARETIARILMEHTKRKVLHFNYRSNSNLIWEDSRLKRRYNYEVCVPTIPSNGSSLLLS